MMNYSTAQALGQARLAELQRQAQHAALARVGRQAPRAQRRQPEYSGFGVLAALTAWLYHPKPAPGPR